jgi:thiol-disulfide isomerase/thioredoxin
MKKRGLWICGAFLIALASALVWWRYLGGSQSQPSASQSTPAEQGMLGVKLNQGASGAIVDYVFPGMPASRADIQVGDQVLSIDGTPVHSSNEMIALVSQRAPRTEVNLVLRRGEQEIKVRSLVGSRQEFDEMTRTDLRGKVLPSQELVRLAGGVPTDLTADMKPVTLITFWATWCPACRASIPLLKELTAKYGAQGFEVRAVTTEDTADVQAFVNEHQIPYPVFIGEEKNLRVEYWVKALPTYLLVGPDRKVVAIGDPSEMENMVNAIPGLLQPTNDVPAPSTAN